MYGVHPLRVLTVSKEGTRDLVLDLSRLIYVNGVTNSEFPHWLRGPYHSTINTVSTIRVLKYTGDRRLDTTVGLF